MTQHGKESGVMKAVARKRMTAGGLVSDRRCGFRACLKNRSVTVDVGFFVGMKAIFRRNTLCISRKIDKMTAEKTRRRVRYRFFKQALIAERPDFHQNVMLRASG